VQRDRVRLVVKKTLQDRGVTSEMVVSVAVVGRRKMRELNRVYHGEDFATDVLSFPYEDPQSNQDVGEFYVSSSEGLVLGDVVVCYPIAVEQAREKQMLVDEVVDFLVEHGVLHLLGEHHE